ncbi:Uncharacterized alpha/beta hydrolase domain [Pseudomonas libanensis]|uniref:T6SS Phospholipase effector Tle1-like catalytic domain-containing protein n=1 Tax=Pseudomonas libanensis TaxID=75588 RepID=A0A0R2YBE0_9PSED|nr:DUF2235 domain-containing protein [Pseudomonas libanensis]KRP45769.1 hypothetical protein TU73_11570 [Pseudomonas libanensis]SDK82658.1 Uncharacterized alpha/beta hydrolase domain [Pseudomonas libanensis]
MNDQELDIKGSVLDRIKSESEQSCPVCQQVMWMSFYFDGFGFSDKAGVPSNIVKLHLAAYERPDKGQRAFYYSGLGTEFDPESGVLAAALADRARRDAAKKIKDTAKDKAKETATETVSDAWSRSKGIRNRSLPRRAIWTTGEVWDEGKESVGNMARQVKRLAKKPRKQWARIERNLRREWQAYWREVTRHPWRAGKTAAQAGVKVTAGYVAESSGLLRDASMIAALFNTGVDSRLNAARRDFQMAILNAKERLPINKIQVAIFGYDMGGGMALAFANRLLDEIAPGGLYEGVPVQIKFMGLFDCVTNRYDDNFLTGFMPLSNKVSSELVVSPQIERCVHYAAAHELRFYKPLSMIGADPEDYRGPRQERLFPGSQVDVGGGAVDGEDGVSDKLSRLPLQMMYHRAYGAGIPMPSLDKLAEIDDDLHQTFVIDTEITAFQRNYRNAVKKLVTVTRDIPSLVLELGRPVERFKPDIIKVQISPSQCVAPCVPQSVTLLPKNIEEELSGHTAIFIHWLRMWYDQNEARAGRKTMGWGLGVPLDPKAYGRYQKLVDELAYLERNARSTPQFNEKQAMRQINGEVTPDVFVTDPQGQALYWLWNNPGARIPEIEALYPHFINDVHDSMAESDLEATFGNLVYSKHYMNRRLIQKLSTKPARSVLDWMELAYEKFFSK